MELFTELGCICQHYQQF